ncbi:DUF805 domain-containing protein [Phenylobacterium sp.]|uniref:DUF805 domain-containing protein n=1 Tax=Phenylobacterium sp. TaxID=1871053 RepID=UPI0012102859|nr:DUF805 domain-containing protein [Phenylobacterium sp.]THD59326.1 MAG: DUF805 domain-containing protein [Phenylobacterium sp.]
MKGLLSYLSFRGRTNRARYWLFVGAFWGIIIAWSMVLTAVRSIFGEGAMAVVVTGLLGLLSLPFLVALFVAIVANAARRLDDRDKSAWWLLLFVGIPGLLLTLAEAGRPSGSGDAGAFSGMLALLSLPFLLWGFVEIGCMPGTKGPNKYGEDPLARAPQEAFA